MPLLAQPIGSSGKSDQESLDPDPKKPDHLSSFHTPTLNSSSARFNISSRMDESTKRSSLSVHSIHDNNSRRSHSLHSIHDNESMRSHASRMTVAVTLARSVGAAKYSKFVFPWQFRKVILVLDE